MSFANLKRDRGQINKLVAAAEAVGGGASSNKYTDDRLWKPTVDKQNNGYCNNYKTDKKCQCPRGVCFCGTGKGFDGF